MRPHTTEQHRHALMPARVAMVEIGENREILPMPLERLQRRCQRVIRARRGREKALLINAVVVRETYEPLEWAVASCRLPGGTQGRKRLEQRQRDSHARALQKFSSVQVHYKNIPLGQALGQANEVRKN